MLVVFLLSFVGVTLSGVAWQMAEWWPEVGLFAANVLLGLLTLGAIGGLLVLRKQSIATLGLNRASWRRVLVAVLVTIPACFMASAASNLIYIAVTGFDFDAFTAERSEFFKEVPEIPVVWVFLISIFVGIHEEVFFRGFLLSRIQTATRSRVWAILITSAIFGSLHFYQGPAGVFQTGAIGLVVAVVVTYTRTLWPAIIAHAAFDVVGILAAPILSDMLDQLEPARILGAAG